ncbi:toll/interleukin-1 receptor domain-containing protein [Roseibium sediminis]|uniref:toll/interleukin-1 receptor domain-containing protein n=1 Tax=Roseibium sediminis TaxID=1775174 RepID=UPI00123DF312|nr:toll/interleukin-1 receptor domain-containing protein [Roseibium sediminis]
MEIFLSWSGDYSRQFANATKDLIELILPSCKPWMSTSIEGGERWSEAIAQRLENANYGIVFLTPDNLQKPWLLFEAGALAKSIAFGRVVPLLLGVHHTALAGPLGQFQGKTFNKENVKTLLLELNNASEDPRKQDIFEKVFEQNWDGYSNKVIEIQNSGLADPERQVPTRSIDEVLEELVKEVRSIKSALNSGIQNSSIGLSSELAQIKSDVSKWRVLSAMVSSNASVKTDKHSKGGLGGSLITSGQGMFGPLASEVPDEEAED